MSVDLKRMRQIANLPMGGTKQEQMEVLVALPSMLDEIERLTTLKQIRKGRRKQLISDLVAYIDYDIWKSLFIKGAWEDEPDELKQKLRELDTIVKKHTEVEDA